MYQHRQPNQSRLDLLMSSLSYMRRWKRDASNHYCDCSRPAVAFNRGYFVCADCLRLQEQDINRRYAKVVGTPEPKRDKRGKADVMWEPKVEFMKTERVGWGPTEQFLQQFNTTRV